MRELVLVVVLIALVACSGMRTHYSRPDVPLPANYVHADPSAKASLDHWWRSFNDLQLNTLIDEALKNNTDLALAALDARAALLQTHLAVTNPAVAAGYTYDYSSLLNGSTHPMRFHSLTTSVSYDIDLWNQLEAVKDVARWEARATVEDRQSIALSVVGTTINIYYELASVNQRISLGRQSIVDAERILQLVNVLKVAGGATQLEIADSEQSVARQKASQSGLLQLRIELRNALAILLNGARWPESAERVAVPEDPPLSVAAGIPASLLQRRPDLRAAELRLRESLARADAARLSFYPAINLTGSAGAATTELAQIVQNPLGTLAASLTLPFVQLNQAKFATELGRVQYDQAAINFRKTLLQAFMDVDNALSARTQLAVEGDQLERALKSAMTAERLYEVRYRAGAVALRPWLDAEETRRQAEIAVAAIRLARLQNFATLCQALGAAPIIDDALQVSTMSSGKSRTP
jgi:NodT family efflux transporter outer membrane factor (OMF) lipoprotein